MPPLDTLTCKHQLVLFCLLFVEIENSMINLMLYVFSSNISCIEFEHECILLTAKTKLLESTKSRSDFIHILSNYCACFLVTDKIIACNIASSMLAGRLYHILPC